MRTFVSTLLACQIIGDLPSNSLAAASAHYLKREIDKTEQTSDWGNSLTASQLRYAALDVVVVLTLGRELSKELLATKQVEVHLLDDQRLRRWPSAWPVRRRTGSNCRTDERHCGAQGPNC